MPSGVLERGLLLTLRFALDHHVNLRPARLYPGVEQPAGRVIRASTSSSCARAPKVPTPAPAVRIRVGTPHEVATEVSLNTAFGVERVVRDAFATARAAAQAPDAGAQDQRADLCGQRCGRASSTRSARDYPDVEVAYQHIDAATIHMVTDPGRFDVIVTDNLFGDIITDLAAAVSGGIGLAASGNIDATRTNPSMFEPVHGSAPDIAGQGMADPTAAIMSVALMLSHVGEADAAARVDKAVEQHLATRGDTNMSTTEVGERIIASL